jgi:hypothetical protein
MRTILTVTILIALLAACGGTSPSLEVASPKLVNTYPAAGAGGLPIHTVVATTFDADVDTAWLAGGFALTDDDGATVAVEMAYDQASLTATFSPTDALAYATTYRAAFTASRSVSKAARTLAEDVSWTFSTRTSWTGGDGTAGDGSVDDGSGGDGSGGGGGSGAGDEPCDDAGCTYVDVDLDTDTIPDGVTWTLENVTFNRDLRVGAGATVLARGILVNGNFVADRAAQIVLIDSRVKGNLEIWRGGTADVQGNRVDGNAEFRLNAGSVNVVDNAVYGNLMADGNTGGVAIVDNFATGNLICSSNVPAPTGGGNRISGSKSGQCSSGF